MIDRMYERKYENVNINLKNDGLEVEYDFNDSEINGKHQACFIPYPDFSSSLQDWAGCLPAHTLQ
jgi:hypothetical protein